MKSLFHLNKYFKKYYLRLIAGIFFVVGANVFAIFPAQIIRQALDLLEKKISYYYLLSGSGFQTDYRNEIFYSALWFGAIIVGLAILKGILMFFMRQTIIVMSRLIERDLKNEIFEHYQKLTLSFYKTNNTGDLMARISEDVSRVRMYIGPAIMYTINLAALFFLVIGIMISVNAKLTLFVLLPLPLLGIAIYMVSTVMENRSDSVQGKLSALSTFAQETFSGIRVLKSFVREKVTAEQFEEASKEYREEALSLARVNALFFPIILALVGLSTLLTVIVGGIEVVAGRATFGTIAEFIYYVNILTWPFATVGWVTSLVHRAAASQNRINEFLNTKPDIDIHQGKVAEIKGEIEFRNVDFTYPDSGIHAARNLSFVIPAGTTTAIVGKTGSGKSTLASLMLRQYDVNSGAVLIDGLDIRSYSLIHIKKQTGFVPQDVFLFSDTINENISFGIEHSEDEKEKIIQAAKAASLYDNVMGFRNGFETILGERGVTLSGGQKQRVSIARALIRDPKILIFDDCLSAVDSQTEEEILSNIRKAAENKTCVIISHRISSIKHAHQILVLEQGKIVESGTHQQLLDKKGVYEHMHSLQLLENELAQ